VGLQPFYYDMDLINPSPKEEIKPGWQEMSELRFTAKQLTDAKNKVRVTISNVRTTVATDDTADIVVTYTGASAPDVYRGVQLTSGDSKFIETVLADSEIVKVGPLPGQQYPTSFQLTGASQSVEIDDMPPATFTQAPINHSAQVFNEKDFDDVFLPNGSLDKVDVFNLLVIPGISQTGIWSHALGFCERKQAFLIMDAPPNYGADTLSGPAETIQDYVGTGVVPISTNGALYFPYLMTPDPVTNKNIPLPPSGSVAGIFARTDVEVGVWKAPAGLKTSILNTIGVVNEGRMTDMRQGVLNPLGVNVLRSFPGSGTVVWGARTLAARDTALQQWWYVPVRRMALYVEQTLLRNLTWVVFEPNDEPLWTAIRMSVEAFMLSLFRQGAFQGSSPSQAFLVRCDATTTTEQDIKLGIVNILVGFRPLKPAEFVIIKIAQLAGQTQP
jgi:phage tail sheath protein FI